jgi:hypothetical protein
MEDCAQRSANYIAGFSRRKIRRTERPKTEAEGKQLERQWFDIAFAAQPSFCSFATHRLASIPF